MEGVSDKDAPRSNESSDTSSALTTKFEEMRISDSCSPDKIELEGSSKDQANSQKNRKQSRTSRANAVLVEMMSMYGLFPGFVTGKRCKFSVRGKAHFHCSKNKTSWTSIYGWALIDLSRGRVVKWFGQGCTDCGTVCSLPYMKTEDFKEMCIFAIEKYLTPDGPPKARKEPRKKMPAHKTALCEKCSTSKRPCNGATRPDEQENKENEMVETNSQQMETIKEIGEEVKKLGQKNVEKVKGDEGTKASKKRNKKKKTSEEVLGEVQNLIVSNEVEAPKSTEQVNAPEPEKKAKRRKKKAKAAATTAALPEGYSYIGDPPSEAPKMSAEQKEKVWNDMAQDLKLVLKSHTLVTEEQKSEEPDTKEPLKNKPKRKNRAKKQKANDADKENSAVSEPPVDAAVTTAPEELPVKEDSGPQVESATGTISKSAQRRLKKQQKKEKALKEESTEKENCDEQQEVCEKENSIESTEKEVEASVQDVPTANASESKKKKNQRRNKKSKLATKPDDSSTEKEGPKENGEMDKEVSEDAQVSLAKNVNNEVSVKEAPEDESKKKNAEEQLKEESVGEKMTKGTVEEKSSGLGVKKEKRKKKSKKKQDKAEKHDTADSKENTVTQSVENCAPKDSSGEALVKESEEMAISADEGPDSQFTKKLLSFMDENDE